jgi:hypothetical protein
MPAAARIEFAPPRLDAKLARAADLC